MRGLEIARAEEAAILRDRASTRERCAAAVATLSGVSFRKVLRYIDLGRATKETRRLVDDVLSEHGRSDLLKLPKRGWVDDADPNAALAEAMEGTPECWACWEQGEQANGQPPGNAEITDRANAHTCRATGAGR